MTLDLFTNVVIRFGIFIQRETQLVIHCHVIFWHTRFDLRLSPGLGGGTQDNSQNMCVSESTVKRYHFQPRHGTIRYREKGSISRFFLKRIYKSWFIILRKYLLRCFFLYNLSKLHRKFNKIRGYGINKKTW